MYMRLIVCLLFISSHVKSKDIEISPENSLVWGPGLSPDTIVMPARYFYIQAVDWIKNKLHASPGNVFTAHVIGDSEFKTCRTWVNILDRKDGSFIVRYKMYHTCKNFQIHVKYQGVHVAKSPYIISNPVYAEECMCPMKSMSMWLKEFGCQSSYNQISSDLKPYALVNFTEFRDAAISRFNHPGSMSVCNYVVKDNQVYRRCYGQYVGFKMFIDAILLSLARKVHLPDMELLVNLGDWPLMSVNQEPHYPLFSWCGSDDSMDIIMPTYDITEATLECMGRVMLDMLSVQGNIDKPWGEKIEKAFWRGRDSSRERLHLIDIARQHPHHFNASLTNFFFFKDQEEKYGPKEKHISFFTFFDYKYQLNMDGTVAAYRFPYLLAGDAVVLKQESKYHEHFYKELIPWKHYIPIHKNLSDLVDKIKWAKENDVEAQNIALSGQKFARDYLMPHDIFCYHAVLFNEWSKHLVSKVIILEGMEHVSQPEQDKTPCECHRTSYNEAVEGLKSDGMNFKRDEL